jgi:formylglycine-generating enzyme required for sulfatase activity
VLRGGSWDSYGKRCRCACRRGDDPGLLVVGFRIVMPFS